MSAERSSGQAAAVVGGPSRPDWDEYFLSLADLAASRSTCLRRRVGAILVSGRRVLATGYNGAPQGMPHCLEVGCLRDRQGIPSGQRHELCRGIHAEQNAILQAAQYGIPIRAATMYCTNQPCTICTKLMLNLDINRLVIRAAYPDELALILLAEAGFQQSEKDGLAIWSRAIPCGDHAV